MLAYEFFHLLIAILPYVLPYIQFLNVGSEGTRAFFQGFIDFLNFIFLLSDLQISRFYQIPLNCTHKL